MLAESVHSLEDPGNQLLLLIGGRRASTQATPDHPFGYDRQRCVSAFVVSIVLFLVGGLSALQAAFHTSAAPAADGAPLVVGAPDGHGVTRCPSRGHDVTPCPRGVGVSATLRAHDGGRRDRKSRLRGVRAPASASVRFPAE